MSLTIDELKVSPTMERCCRALDAAFPGIITFTSGLRSLHEQARAMAVNHLQEPRAYLMSQYVHAAEFLEALRGNPMATSADEITEVFFDIMRTRPDLIRSPHLTGHAVDLRPMEQVNGEPTAQGGLVILWIRSRPETIDFRTREGKLKRWHWAVMGQHTVPV